MRLSAAAFAVLTACHAIAQDDPLESRSFVVAFLTGGHEDRPGVPLGLAQDAIGTSVRAGGEFLSGALGEDDLIDFLKRDVAPDSWKRPGAKLEFRDGRLIVVNGRLALDGVAAWLEGTRGRQTRRIAVEAALLLVPLDRWGRVEPKDLQGVSKVLQASRLFARSGTRVHAQRISQVSYIRDHDVQIASGAGALDPIVDVVNSGERIDVIAWSDPGASTVLMEARAEVSVFEGMDERTLKLLKQDPVAPPPAAAAGAAEPRVVAKDCEALVQLPRITLDQYRGQVRARAGETVVAFSASRADGVVALVLTPAFVGGPAAAPEPPTRFYDVTAITNAVQDWAGPKAHLVSPSQGGGGPLTGATFTLDEPRMGYGAERLLDDVRAVVDPPGTPGDRSAATETAGGAVALRTGHAAAEKLLAETFQRETRTVASEAALIAFRAGAKDEWARKVPALAPGGCHASAEVMAPLFEEARKGDAVRWAATIALSGRVGQSVFAGAGRQRAYVQDVEPQVSSYSAQNDPIIGVFVTGLGFQARPTRLADGGAMKLELRFWNLTGDVGDEKMASTDTGPIQRARVEGPRWDVDAVCLPGHWTLAALESRNGEDWALFVRVRD